MFNVLIMTWVVLSCQQRFPSSYSANEKQELDLSELELELDGIVCYKIDHTTTISLSNK